jgi:hypothetical protein
MFSFSFDRSIPSCLVIITGTWFLPQRKFIMYDDCRRFSFQELSDIRYQSNAFSIVKASAYCKLALKYWSLFIESFLSPASSKSTSAAAVAPDDKGILSSSEWYTMIVHAKVGEARLASRASEIFEQQVSSMTASDDKCVSSLVRSLRAYEWICKFASMVPAEALEKIRKEAELAKEMTSMLPSKISRLVNERFRR